MKKLLIIAILFLAFTINNYSFAFDLGLADDNRQTNLIIMLGASGDDIGCAEAVKHNFDALKRVLSPDSIMKLNVKNIYIGYFNEQPQILFKIKADSSIDRVRFQNLAAKSFAGINEVKKRIENQSKFKTSRDSFGMLMFVKGFIQEQNLIEDNNVIIVISKFEQTLAIQKSLSLVKANPITFPKNTMIVILGQSFLCENVAEIQKQMFYNRLRDTHLAAIKGADVKLYTSY